MKDIIILIRYVTSNLLKYSHNTEKYLINMSVYEEETCF